MTNIWIDADSCPAMVREHSVKIGHKYNLKVFFVANKNIPCKLNLPFEMIITETQKDSADNYIFENSSTEDIVITKDIVFADRLVEKGVYCINDRGTHFTKENIKELLSDRDFDFQLAQAGLVKHFHEGYDKKKFAKFANCLDKILHKLMII